VKEKIDGGKVSKKKGRKGKKKTLLKINFIFCTSICTSLKPINNHAVMKQSQMISPRFLPHVKFISSHTVVNTHGLVKCREAEGRVYIQQPWIVLRSAVPRAIRPFVGGTVKTWYVHSAQQQQQTEANGQFQAPAVPRNWHSRERGLGGS
jgi:hypothetical protein